MKPGFHHIPDAEYHALRFCSKHSLDVLHHSTPMHLLHERENPTPPTEAMLLGSAVHCLLLEPTEFERRHPVAGKCCKSTAKGDPCKNTGVAMLEGQWYCGVHIKGFGQHADRPDGAISDEQYVAVTKMRDAVIKHASAEKLLSMVGENELAAIWERDGITCKLKADGYRESHRLPGIIFDIKTTASASRAEFERSIANYGYHRQAAWYLDGFARLGRPVENFVFICVEKAAPYGVAVYRLLDDAIEIGRAENDRLFALYAECERSNNWPGYSNLIEDVKMPAWAMKRGLEITTEGYEHV